MATKHKFLISKRYSYTQNYKISMIYTNRQMSSSNIFSDHTLIIIVDRRGRQKKERGPAGSRFFSDGDGVSELFVLADVFDSAGAKVACDVAFDEDVLLIDGGILGDAQLVTDRSGFYAAGDGIGG